MYSVEIIEALGGYRLLAASLNIGRTGVFAWIKNGIPSGRCVEIAEIAKRLGRDKPFRSADGKRMPGITLEILMHSTPRLIPKTEKPRTASMRKRPAAVNATE